MIKKYLNRLFIDGLSGMAFGLFSTLIIGTIICQIAKLVGGNVVGEYLTAMGNVAKTLTGAGIGGAAGAYTAYQGAQSEIDERWVAAVREYKDSLQKFYCGTGQRFLSFYNDATVIPRQN